MGLDDIKLGPAALTSWLELASGGRKRHVPFSMLEADTHAFVAAKYLPARMTLKDPRNMTKGQILTFLAHVDEREKRYGLQDGFRFHCYYNGTDMVPAEYPINVDEAAEQAAGVKAQKARASKKSRKGKEKGKEKEVAPPNQSDTQSRQTYAGGHNTITAGHNSRHSDAAGIISDSNIDPSLLAAGPVPPQSSDDEDAPQSSTRRIGDAEMAVLVKLGHPPVVPINGPQDGLPQYEVTSAAYQLYVSKLLSQRNEDVPKTRGRPRKPHAEDSQGMADPTTNPANNTRSRATTNPAKNTRSRAIKEAAIKEAEALKKETQSGTRRSTRQKK